MLAQITRCSLLAVCVIVAGCSTPRPLPKYEKPIARAQFQQVRTTAYTHTEADHRRYACNSALGTPLKCGSINSAACDWSRWPAGTIFRVLDTGELFQVDDYGWALAGTNTIDLYKGSRSAMNAWGVRRVNIEVLSWGDPWKSHDVLKPRAKHRHVERMVKQIRDRYTRTAPTTGPQIARAVPVSGNVAVASVVTE
jgi:3D (Asp-Asp-Asp) domain-containing protein